MSRIGFAIRVRSRPFFIDGRKSRLRLCGGKDNQCKAGPQTMLEGFGHVASVNENLLDEKQSRGLRKIGRLAFIER